MIEAQLVELSLIIDGYGHNSDGGDAISPNKIATGLRQLRSKIPMDTHIYALDN
jgi:hypothetical protein